MDQSTDKTRMTAETAFDNGSFQLFDSLASFSQAVTAATGLTFDLASVVGLNTDFMEASERYLLLNIKEYGVDKPDNMLFLGEDKVFAFSSNCPSPPEIKTFEDLLEKPFGKSTVFCFLVLDKIMENHKKQLEIFINRIRKLEENFDHAEYRRTALEIERFSDRLEEYHDLLLGLQERRYKQVETNIISFDYRVLIAESLSLQGRCRRRVEVLQEVRKDHEMRATEELNQRLVKLNDVVKRLTAITIILMLPTLIASHFGMNFQYMPELHVWWAYPAVIFGQIAIVVAGIIWFRKIEWL